MQAKLFKWPLASLFIAGLVTLTLFLTTNPVTSNLIAAGGSFATSGNGG